MMNMPGWNPAFNAVIGGLDYFLSALMNYSKDQYLSIENRQTLKHHAEDMIAAGNKIIERLGKDQEGTPQFHVKHD